MTKLMTWFLSQRDVICAYPWHFGIAAGMGAVIGVLGRVYVA